MKTSQPYYGSQKNDKQRSEILRLRDVEKQSWREIGKRLGISFQRVIFLYKREHQQKEKKVRVNIETQNKIRKSYQLQQEKMSVAEIDRIIEALDD